MLTHPDDGSSLFTNSELSNQPEKSPTGQYVAKSPSAQLVNTARLSVDHLAPTVTTPRSMQSEAANLTKPIKPIEQTDPLVVTISEEICKAIEPFLNATAKPASLTDIEKLIIKASEKNSPEVLKAHLISNGPLENQNLESLLTALLLFSAKKGYWDCARILIEFGSANVNGADIDSENFMLPLKQAVIQGNAEMVQFLIKNGADMGVNRQIKNEIIISTATDCEDEDEVEDECEMMVDTPLMIALDQGNEEIIRILTSFPDKGGRTALMHAIEWRDKEVVRLIINKAGPELLDQLLNVQDVVGNTPLLLAAKGDIFLTFLQALKAVKKDINRINFNDIKNNIIKTPLMFATERGHKEALKLLIEEAKADPVLLDKLFAANDGIFWAVHPVFRTEKTMEALIQALIAADINPNKYLNIKNKDGHTPLMLMVQCGYEEALKLLIEEAKADPALLDKLFTDSDKDGNTLFALAGHNGKKEIMEVLIQALIAADINPNKYLNIQNKEGHTPLMLAAKNGHQDTIKLLLTKAGVDLNVRDHKHKTALMHAALYAAKNNKKWENIEILDRYGANISDIHEVLAEEISWRAKEIEKNGLTRLAQNLITNGASLKTANKINDIKKWGAGASIDSNKKPVEGYRFVKVKRYSFPNMSCVNKETIKKLIVNYENMEKFNEMIDKMVKPLPDNNFVQKEQKVGNCTWASAKGIIALLLRVATSETPEELSRAVAANKEFTAWTRAEALRELLASNPDPSLVLLFIKKYFNKLFGPNGFSFIWIGILESPKFSSKDKKTAINKLVSSLKQEMESSSRPGIKDIGGQLENWLTKLSSQL